MPGPKQSGSIPANGVPMPQRTAKATNGWMPIWYTSSAGREKLGECAKLNYSISALSSLLLKNNKELCLTACIQAIREFIDAKFWRCVHNFSLMTSVSTSFYIYAHAATKNSG